MIRELAIDVLVLVFDLHGWLMGRLRPDMYARCGLRWVSCPWPRQTWVKDTRDYTRWTWLIWRASGGRP